MLDFRLKMFESDRLRRSCAPSISSILHHQSHILPLSTSSINNLTSNIQRSALTLIELLVVIVILTTLVGGVIPILSPNNDVRKIQVAARGLQGYINLTQAQAARTGRPHGIAFRESSPESGVALEVFGLEVPPPFAGFSTESRIRVDRAEDVVTNPMTDDITYGPKHAVKNPQGNDRTRFSPQYFGFDLYRLRFELTAVPVFTPDQLPPRTFRIGDVIDVGGNQFLIVDDDRQSVTAFAPSTLEYVDPALNTMEFKDSLICVWINNTGQVAPQGLKQYQINRQPTNSSASPYQLPAGIVIDMQASVTEGNDVGNRFPTAQSLSRTATGLTDTVGIMFSPTGAVDSVIFNGNELTSVSRIVLLLGRIENGGINPSLTPWFFTNVNDADELKQKQEEINWLNLDSRLLSIITSNGRAVVSEPAFFDPSILGLPDANDPEEQIEAAHGFAHEMTTAK